MYGHRLWLEGSIGRMVSFWMAVVIFEWMCLWRLLLDCLLDLCGENSLLNKFVELVLISI